MAKVARREGKHQFLGGKYMWTNYPDILTTDDACKLLRVSKHTIYKLINSNELKARKIARHYRIQKAELLKFLDRT